MQAAVIGAGAWGTALADLLARRGHNVRLWAYEADVAEGINTRRENMRFLRGVPLDPHLRAVGVLADAIVQADLIVFATPSHVLRTVVRKGAGAVESRATLAVATKGIEADTLALMTDVVSEELPSRSVVALSGPSFAIEVAQGQPTAVVAASGDPAAAVRVQEACSGDTFRVYTHDDVVGVELGGALKNVMAIAVGVADGLGLGFNSRAALITRGLAEMARLGEAAGARGRTFAGLAGMGDLVLTCTGPLSRNRTLGVEIGRGKSLDEALRGKETVAEGVETSRAAQAMARSLGVKMPIVDAVNRVLFDGEPPRDAIRALMSRELRGEQD
jgi:glycerol-3-phosphate dehydrogenase (NAD(P)+)